jgi:hypothetical protein
LGWGEGEDFDIMEGVDALGCQPVAEEQVVAGCGMDDTEDVLAIASF